MKKNLIDYILVAVVVIIITIIGTVLIENLRALNSSYNTVVNQVLKDVPKSEVEKAGNYSALLAFSRAKDFSNMKASAMFVGFLLIFTGALYLIKVFNLSYSINVNKADVGSMSVNSNSPGLVMVSLGVVVMLCVLLIKTDVDYNFETSGSGNGQGKKELDSIIQVYLNQVQVEKEVSDECVKCCPVVVEKSNNNKKRKSTIATGRPTIQKTNWRLSLPSYIGKNIFISFTDKAEMELEQSNPQIQQLIALMKQDPNLKIRLSGRVAKETVAEQAMMIKVMATTIKTLLANNGIQLSRIRVISHGESNPVASDDSTEKIEQNGVVITYENQ